MSSGPALRLRRAEASDDALLFELYAASRRDEFAAVGLPSAQLALLLRMQYEAQRRAYAAAVPEAEHAVMMDGASAVGRVIVHRSGTATRVVDIFVVPERRGAGLGTAVLAALCAESDRGGKRTELTVARANRAAALYRRLGFRVVGETATDLAMERAPA